MYITNFIKGLKSSITWGTYPKEYTYLYNIRYVELVSCLLIQLEIEKNCFSLILPTN